jgi:hypothetical protein
VDVALRGDTTIEWSWRVEALPGTVPENTPRTQDLLGIAAVFAGRATFRDIVLRTGNEHIQVL